MKKFRTNAFRPRIEHLEVVKETAKQIVFTSSRGLEIREAKEGRYSSWFETWEEAKDHLATKAQKKIISITSKLLDAKNDLEEIRMFRPF